MNRKEWNNTLDKYLCTGNLSSDEYFDMNEVQMTIIQELKKAFKRIQNNERFLPKEEYIQEK